MAPPRLLDKREIDARKAQDRNREIAEGTKLTRRVDGLRELAAETEAGLEKYRTATLRVIQEEIDAKFAEKEELEEALVILRAEYTSKRIPLDAEWEKVTEEKKSNSDLKEDLYLRKEQVEYREQAVEAEKRELDVKKSRVDALMHDAKEKAAQAEDILAQARAFAALTNNKVRLAWEHIEAAQAEVAEEKARNAENKKVNEDTEKKLAKQAILQAKAEQTLQAGWRNLEKTKQKLHGI